MLTLAGKESKIAAIMNCPVEVVGIMDQMENYEIDPVKKSNNLDKTNLESKLVIYDILFKNLVDSVENKTLVEFLIRNPTLYSHFSGCSQCDL